MWGGQPDPWRCLQQDGPAGRFALAASLPAPTLMNKSLGTHLPADGEKLTTFLLRFESILNLV